jgi:hypothetical protein
MPLARPFTNAVVTAAALRGASSILGAAGLGLPTRFHVGLPIIVAIVVKAHDSIVIVELLLLRRCLSLLHLRRLPSSGRVKKARSA